MPNGNNAARPTIPSLRIPSGYEGGFLKLLALTDEDVSALSSQLANEPPTLGYRELLHETASGLSDLPLEDADEVAEVLFAMYSIRSDYPRSSLPEFVEGVLRAMDESEVKDLELSGEDRDRFKDHLVTLLGANSITVGMKANELLVEYEHTLHDARVLTDIRPVFGPDTEEPPAGAVVVHMLKIGYHDASDEVKEFFVALDTADVDRLIRTLKRANQKAESLRGVIEATEVPYIDAG